MVNEESGQDRFIRCNIKNSTIMMGNKTPLSLCFNDVVSTAFSSSNFSHIFFFFNPFAPGDFAEKRVLKLVEWFSGHCRAIKS